MTWYIIILFTVNLGFLIYNHVKIDKSKLFHTNLYKVALLKRLRRCGKESSLLVKAYLGLIFSLYFLLDWVQSILGTIIKRKFGKWGKLYNSLIELVVVAFLVIGIVFYSEGGEHPFFLFFFVWRISLILTIRLNEIAFLKSRKPSMHSFIRTFVISIFNFAELTLGFAFIYTSKCIQLFKGRSLNSLIETFGIYTSWTGPKPETLQPNQGILIIVQVFVFLIFVVTFLANINAFNYKLKE